MPELPEIEALKLSLEPHLPGKKINKVTINRLNLRYPLKPNLHEQVLGSKIVNLSRRAKYLIIKLSNSNSLIIHLGMSGRFTLTGANYAPQKHDHVVFYLNSGKCLVFNDARRFGMIEVIASHLLADKLFNNLGPEPLDSEFNTGYLYDKIHHRRLPIKNALMNNTIVVGIGNIYAAESLFLAAIAPITPSNTLTVEQLRVVVSKIKQVLKDAIWAGGTTLKDFIGGLGTPGHFKQKLYVYGRAGAKCVVCDDIILTVKQSGRASFYCPTCQKF